MSRLRLRQLAQDGATDGQGVQWNSALGRWVAGTFTGYTDEQVRDVIGAALVAGGGVTITVNDAGDTLTVTVDHGGIAGLGDDDHPQYQLEAEKGTANGYASLGSDGKVPTAQLPALSTTFWDDVLTAAGGETIVNLGAVPISRSERVWLNQTLLDRGVDYTIAGADVTLLAPLAAADKVRLYYATTGTPSAAGFATSSFYSADYTGVY